MGIAFKKFCNQTTGLSASGSNGSDNGVRGMSPEQVAERAAKRYRIAAAVIFFGLIAWGMLGKYELALRATYVVGPLLVAWYYIAHKAVADAENGFMILGALIAVLTFGMASANHNWRVQSEEVERIACAGVDTESTSPVATRCSAIQGVLHAEQYDYSDDY